MLLNSSVSSVPQRDSTYSKVAWTEKVLVTKYICFNTYNTMQSPQVSTMSVDVTASLLLACINVWKKTSEVKVLAKAKLTGMQHMQCSFSKCWTVQTDVTSAGKNVKCVLGRCLNAHYTTFFFTICPFDYVILLLCSCHVRVAINTHYMLWCGNWSF